MASEVMRKFRALPVYKRLELVMALLLEKGVIDTEDIRRALLPAMTCSLCDDYTTGPCETTEHAERLIMRHLRDCHPEAVGRASRQLIEG